MICGLRTLVSSTICSLLLACSSESPTKPTAPEIGLVIAPTISAIRLSERVTLTATLDGRPANPTWSSSDESIIAITPSGVATAMALGTVSVRATLAAESTNTQIRSVPDFRGHFTGKIDKVACQRLSGSGPNVGCQPGTARFDLSIEQQTGANASGVIDLYAEPTVGQISGSIDTLNHLVVTGTARSADAQIVTMILSWDTQLTDLGLTGTFSSDTQEVNAFGPQHFSETWKLLNVLRQ